MSIVIVKQIFTGRYGLGFSVLSVVQIVEAISEKAAENQLRSDISDDRKELLAFGV